MTSENAADEARKARERGPLQAMIGGAVLLGLGPLVGILITVIRLVQAFDTVGGPAVPPDDKAKVLAAGISSAMNATYVGLAISSAGLFILIVAGISLARARRPNERPTPTDAAP